MSTLSYVYIKGDLVSHFWSAVIMRRTAACDHYILISVRIWVGGGSTSLKGTMLTSALARVPTFAARTPPTARWDKDSLKSQTCLQIYLIFILIFALLSPAAEPLQHFKPRSICLPLLCSSGLGAPHNPLLRWTLSKSRAALKHGCQVLQMQLNFRDSGPRWETWHEKLGGEGLNLS